MINNKNLKRGFIAGFPIGLGYLSVSFSFGIMASSIGLKIWQAVLISMLTVTSAGQLCGLGIMILPYHYMEMLLSQITINIRYSFMSLSLSQKADAGFKGVWRWLFGFMMTDEIFAVASHEGDENGAVGRSFFAGLCILPYVGWALGTFIGALLGNILPESVMNALLIAFYGMFVAIVIPEFRKEKAIAFTVIISIILSLLFNYMPIIKSLSSGLTITICSIIAASIGAILFPIKEDETIE